MTVSPSSSDWPTSALAAAATAFAKLTCEPAPLSLDCDRLAADGGADLGLPSGLVPLPALRAWLMRPDTTPAARHVVWRELVLRARLDGPHWMVAAAGMAMPGLQSIAWHLDEFYPGDRDDLDAEILTGFIAALKTYVDRHQPDVFGVLIGAAMNAGRRLIDSVVMEIPVDEEVTPLAHHAGGSATPRLPYGHVDLLMERAASLKLISEEDVEPWTAARIFRRPAHEIAERLGLDEEVLRMRLARTDKRLVEAVRSGVLTDGVMSPEARSRAARNERRRQAGRAPVTAIGRTRTQEAGTAPLAAAA